jgi:elongator complex protein 4
MSGLTRWVEMLSDGVLELAPFPSHANLSLATSVPGSAMSQEEPPQGILKFYEIPIFHEKGGGEHQSSHTDDLAFTLSRRKGLAIKPFSLPPLDNDNPDQHQHESGHSQGKTTKIDIEF